MTQLDVRFGIEPAGLRLNVQGLLDGIVDKRNAPPDAYPTTFEIDVVVPYRLIPELHGDWDKKTPEFRAQTIEQIKKCEARFGRAGAQIT